ncbi:MAG: tripartite tricarboxylate transporter family receptor [Hyphomicrobiales bacterium]|nr:tripartite tricarboxylate transporter family receptor [Hyphomicrobiales bacterium]
MKSAVTSWLTAIMTSFLFVSSGTAGPVEDFYRGKQIALIVPSGVGGGYDLYSRFLARYLGKHIPGSPSVVVKNMPGAGGIAAANYIYSIAPADGLTIGSFQNTITLNQLAKMPSVKFDVRKFGWIGNMSIASTICAFSGGARNLGVNDLLSQEVLIGATFGSPSLIPSILNSLAGTHFKIVQGYVSTSNVLIAMESGEVNGLCGWSWDGARVNAQDMLSRGVAKVAVDIAIQPQPELQKLGVPFLMDSLPAGEKKDVLNVILSTQVYNRPFGVPPGVPEDRLQALRTAFELTMRDTEVRAEAEKLGLDLQYLAPEKIVSLLGLALDAPVGIQERAIEELRKAGFGG